MRIKDKNYGQLLKNRILSMRQHAGPNATTNYIVSIIFTVILDASSLKETGKNWKATCRTSLAGHGHPVLIPAAKFLVNLLDVDRLPELHWADEVDPWSRPFSFWDRPWKQVCAESLSGGVFSCGSQSCRAKSFGSETAFWQHLCAKAHTRGHPDREIIKKREAEAARGEVYTPLVVDPNWVSGLAEMEQQAKLKESMRLTLKEPSNDEGQEDGEESTGGFPSP